MSIVSDLPQECSPNYGTIYAQIYAQSRRIHSFEADVTVFSRGWKSNAFDLEGVASSSRLDRAGGPALPDASQALPDCEFLLPCSGPLPVCCGPPIAGDTPGVVRLCE